MKENPETLEKIVAVKTDHEFVRLLQRLAELEELEERIKENEEAARRFGSPVPDGSE